MAICTKQFDASLISFHWKAQYHLSQWGSDSVQQAEPGVLVCPRHTPCGASLSWGLGCVDEGGILIYLLWTWLHVRSLCCQAPHCSLQYQYTKEWSIQVPPAPKQSHLSAVSLAFPTKCPTSLSKEGREKEKSEARAGLGERPHCVGGGRAGWLFELPPLLSQGLISPPSTKASRVSIWTPLLSPAPLCTSQPPPTRCKLA